MKQYIRKYFFVSIFYIILPLLYTIQPLHAGFDMGNISEEDMMAMQQELQAQIDSMSDAERESFYQIMENVERMSQEDPEALERFITGTMTKEEEAEFVKNMVPEEEATPEAPLQPKEELPKEETKEQPKVEMLTDAQLSLQEMIISCIAKTESFLVKMQSYPEINTRIRSWTRNNSLTSWPDSKQWKDVEFDINIFIQKISAIANEKNKSKKNGLIDAFSKNGSLLASLTAINDALISYEKNVDIAPFGIVKIKKETKVAMQKILNIFTAQLYNTQINTQLTEILKSYESEDKKLKEDEDALIKKAQQEREKPRSKEYMKSAGQEKSSSRGSRSTYGSDYDNYGGSYGGNYDNYSSYYPSSYDSYDSYSPSSYDSSSRSSSANSGGSSSIGSRRGESSYGDDQDFYESEESQTQAPSSQEASATNATKKASTSETKPSRKKIDPKDKILDDMAEYFDTVKVLISKKQTKTENKKAELNESFRDLVTLIQNKELSLEDLKALTEKMSNIVRTLTGAKSLKDSLKALKMRLSKESKEVQSEYKQLVKDLYAQYSPLLNKLLLQIKNIEEHLPQIKEKIPMPNFYALWDRTVVYVPTSISTVQKSDVNDTLKKGVIKDNTPLNNNPITVISKDDDNKAPQVIEKENKNDVVQPTEEKTEQASVVSTQYKELVKIIPEVTTLKDLKLALEMVDKEMKKFVK
jgi:hypothetical protein